MLGKESVEECAYYVNATDYDGDGMMNEREVVPLVYVYQFTNSEMTGREAQINCSECSGMDSYNA